MAPTWLLHRCSTRSSKDNWCAKLQICNSGNPTYNQGLILASHHNNYNCACDCFKASHMHAAITMKWM